MTSTVLLQADALHNPATVATLAPSPTVNLIHLLELTTHIHQPRTTFPQRHCPPSHEYVWLNPSLHISRKRCMASDPIAAAAVTAGGALHTGSRSSIDSDRAAAIGFDRRQQQTAGAGFLANAAICDAAATQTTNSKPDRNRRLRQLSKPNSHRLTTHNVRADIVKLSLRHSPYRV